VKKKPYLWIRPIIPGLVLLFLMGPLMGWVDLSAAVFAVNDNGDDGDAIPGDGNCRTTSGQNRCTLRAAIEEANAYKGKDIIQIPPMTILLVTMLTITEDLSIVGAGKDNTIIDGNHATRGFYFRPRTGTHSLSHLTIRNTRVTRETDPIIQPLRNGNGGGILNESDLTLTEVQVVNGEALQGGGIYNMLAFTDADQTLVIPSLTLQSVLIMDNTGTSQVFGDGGGGLFNGSLLSGVGVTLKGNRAVQGGGLYNNSYYSVSLSQFEISNNIAKFGGGFFNDLGPRTGSITLNQGVIRDNTAECCSPWTGDSTGGGGIYNNDGAMALNQVSLINNASTSSGGYGGGLYNWKNMTIENSTLQGNKAAYGAGIYTGNYDGQPSTVVITNSTLSGNMGTSSSSPVVDAIAGGIWNGDGGSLRVYNSTITNNSSRTSGGVESRPNAALTLLRNTILAGNVALASSDCRGVFSTEGGNLIGSVAGCGFAAIANDQVNIDPKLGPLQFNGGFTLTHTLRGGSPAIDMATDSSCPVSDQRGIRRPVAGKRGGEAHCDIGAYEFVPPSLFIPLIWSGPIL
jgi:hypothetical protein